MTVQFIERLKAALVALAQRVGGAFARMWGETSLKQSRDDLTTEHVEAEKALRERDAQLRLAVEAASLATWDRNVQTGDMLFNRHWFEMLGFAPDELEPHFRTVQCLTHPDDWPLLTRALESHLSGQTPVYECEYRMRNKTGRWLWVQARGRVIERAEDGRPLRIGGTVQDITKRREAEALARAQAELLDLTQDAIYLLDLPTATVSFWNRSAAVRYGYSAQEALGQPVTALLKTVFPEPLDLLVRKFSETGQWEGELVHICRDGRAIAEASSWSMLRDRDGQPTAAMQVNRDITERKRAELALKASEERFRALFESAADAMFIHALTGNILAVNQTACERLGYTRAELSSMSVADVDAPEYTEQIPDHLAEIVQKGEAVFRTAHITRHGVRIPIEAHARLIDYDGQQVCFTIARDLTERLLMEEKLVQQQKLESIGVLAGGIAHEFNNIFQAVLAEADLAQRAIEPDHPAGRHLQKTIRPMERAASLTRQLMAYAGLGKYFVQAEDLAEIVRDTESLVRTVLPEGTLLNLSLPAGLPTVRADRSQVQQVLMNLLLNAGEAVVDHRGTVSVAIGRETVGDGHDETIYVAGAAPQSGEYVYLQVTDNGTGMDAATLARACEPFFSTRGAGRGLGLPAVLGIVRSHAGGMTLQSRPGLGTMVTVLWPVGGAVPIPKFPPSDDAGIGTPTPAGQDAPRRATVLLVDDEAEVLEALADVLLMSGTPALIARNGQEAVALFAERHAEIGLVILDVLMPVMNGGAALRELRRLDPSVPIVLASGYDDHEIERRLTDWQISERPDGILQKPFGVRTVMDTASRFLPGVP